MPSSAFSSLPTRTSAIASLLLLYSPSPPAAPPLLPHANIVDVPLPLSLSSLLPLRRPTHSEDMEPSSSLVDIIERRPLSAVAPKPPREVGPAPFPSPPHATVTARTHSTTTSQLLLLSSPDGHATTFTSSHQQQTPTSHLSPATHSDEPRLRPSGQMALSSPSLIVGLPLLLAGPPTPCAQCTSAARSTASRTA
ncbi:uncharacterized protein LOC122050230 [Zingiber officinale]|uniref:uncharacterized protein LOC122050230 n=1 Tax=Zingiber officinale TaxID=94328 RepID=UPI001C4C269D|nr:uncharacterized protein LOC122050230 [Zingiber officinale]